MYKRQLLDGSEIECGTDPRDPDTDDDGIPDGVDPDPLHYNPRYRSRIQIYRLAIAGGGQEYDVSSGHYNGPPIHKGDRLKLTIRVGFEDPDHNNYPELSDPDNINSWGPLNITIYFNQTWYMDDGTPVIDTEHASACPVVGWQQVNNPVGHWDIGGVHYVVFQQDIWVNIPDNIFAGAVAISANAAFGWPGLVAYMDSWHVIL